MAERELHSTAAAAAAGDRRSTRLLFDEIWPPLVRYCRARVGPHDGCWEFADGIAGRAGIDVPRRYRRHDVSTPFHEFLYAVADHAVRDAQPASGDPMGALPSTERLVLILRVIEGMSVGETATALGLPNDRVRLAQHRAMRSLSAQVA